MRVIEKLDFLVRFWELRARHATLGNPLSSAEQIELLSLMQLVTSELELPRAGPTGRTRCAVPAQLIGDGAVLAMEVRYVSAAALIVAAEGRVPAGARVIVRAADAVGGVEYALPCTVAWTHTGRPNTMALVVDGIPTRRSFSSVAEIHVRATLVMGRQERFLG
jgi:hypothetical protein